MRTNSVLSTALLACVAAAAFSGAFAWKGDCRHIKEECDCDGERRDDSRGGAGMLTAQVSWLNTEPLEKLNRLEKDLRKDFDFHHNAMPVFGAVGYYDIGNGLRTGGGLWAGYKSFQSESYTGLAPDSLERDSVVTLRVIPAYLGFNLEKTIPFPGFKMYLGGMLGGGVYTVHRQFYDVEGDDFFVSVEDDTLSEEEFDEDYGSFAFAPFVAWDVHGGATMTLAPVFHISLDGVLLFTYAPEGFGFGFGDFLTVNPGIRLRFIFGKSV